MAELGFYLLVGAMCIVLAFSIWLIEYDPGTIRPGEIGMDRIVDTPPAVAQEAGDGDDVFW